MNTGPELYSLTLFNGISIFHFTLEYFNTFLHQNKENVFGLVASLSL